MKLILASNNRNKSREFSRMFRGFTISLPSDCGIDFSYREKGNDFLENAFGKAKKLFRMTGVPVLSDDSGLSVHALGGEPGVFSARHGSDEKGKRLAPDQRNRYLL